MIRISPTGSATLITDKPRPPRFTRRRIALILGGLIIAPFLAIFLIGATVGIYKGITESGAPQLPSHTQQILNDAQAHSKTPCWAEWNPKVEDNFEVICGANKADSTVADYNDGFATSKQDDCDQGFQAACEWVRTTK